TVGCSGVVGLGPSADLDAKRERTKAVEPRAKTEARHAFALAPRITNGSNGGMASHVTSTGVLVLSDDGRVYIRKVKGGYGGYDWSFAKGRIEHGLSLEQNALKE